MTYIHTPPGSDAVSPLAYFREHLESHPINLSFTEKIPDIHAKLSSMRDDFENAVKSSIASGIGREVGEGVYPVATILLIFGAEARFYQRLQRELGGYVQGLMRMNMETSAEIGEYIGRYIEEITERTQMLYLLGDILRNPERKEDKFWIIEEFQKHIGSFQSADRDNLVDLVHRLTVEDTVLLSSEEHETWKNRSQTKTPSLRDDTSGVVHRIVVPPQELMDL